MLILLWLLILDPIYILCIALIYEGNLSFLIVLIERPKIILKAFNMSLFTGLKFLQMSPRPLRRESQPR